MTSDTLPSGRATAPRHRKRWLAAALGLSLALAWVGLHLAVDSAGGRVRLRGRAERALRERLGEVAVGSARLDWLFRAEFRDIEVRSSRPGAPPLVRAERAVATPRFRSLLEGRIEPGSVTLYDVRVDSDPSGIELRRRARFEARGATGGGPLPALHVRRMTWALPVGGGEVLELGPLDLDGSLVRHDGETRLEAGLALPGGGSARAELRRSEHGTELRGEADLSLPSDLPRAVVARFPFDFDAGSLRLEVEASSGSDLGAGAGQFRAEVRGLELGAARLGPRPLGPLSMATEGTFQWDRATHRASLGQVRVSLGDGGSAVLAAEANYTWASEPMLSLEARTARLTWAGLLAALPEDLRPPDDAPHLDGPLSARLDFSTSLAHPADCALAVDLDLEDLRRSARAGPASRLLGAFTWRPPEPGPEEPALEIAVGPSNPAFVPIAQLPPSLIRAVTASEDAGFFAHRGFDFQEIANALGEARSGRIRGASTITQQLAKNLFLGPDRTVSRKVREALATVALEVALPKTRLLEIYLNIAEWGPGVYGVGEASRFWFDKDARLLSPKESAFLASVIPSPRRFAARARRVGVSPWWQDRVSDILGKMWIQGQLTDEELAAALDEPLRLRPGLIPTPAEGALSEPEAPLEEEAPSEPEGDQPAPSSPR